MLSDAITIIRSGRKGERESTSEFWNFSQQRALRQCSASGNSIFKLNEIEFWNCSLQRALRQCSASGNSSFKLNERNDRIAGRNAHSFRMRNVETNFIQSCRAAEAKNYEKHFSDNILKLTGNSVLLLPPYNFNVNAMDNI